MGGARGTCLPYHPPRSLATLGMTVGRSTREYDAGQKYELYRAIPSLRDYLLVDQYAIEVEHRFLDGREWHSQSYSSREETVTLTGVPVSVSLTDVYALVELTAGTSAPPSSSR